MRSSPVAMAFLSWRHRIEPVLEPAMLTALSHNTAPALRPLPVLMAPPVMFGAGASPQVAQRIAETFALLQECVDLQRRVVHTGDLVCLAGDTFDRLHIVSTGFCKTLNTASDGREQVVGLHFKGDWIGFDGIATGRHGSDAVAMDTGEVWSLRYDALLAACARRPELLGVLHEAMSREISRDRESMMSLCTLPADARVAEFLRQWATSLAERGLRTDQITLRMTRAEIGNYLGMTLETVSRALSRLARNDVIRFTEKGRRDIQIPAVQALSDFIATRLAPAPTTIQ
jgi:CRP/FNR family transcriptional regulator